MREPHRPVSGSSRNRVRDWPDADLESVAACPACGSVERELLYGGLVDQVFAIAGGEWSLQRCGACSSAFLDPRPAEHALGRLYAGEYYTHTAPVDPAQPRRGVKFAFRARALLDPRFRFAHARLTRHLQLPRAGARLLDVGCGSGQFVASARALGWDASGIDTDAVAVEAGRSAGLPLSTTTLEEIARTEPGSFDAVTMEHVLEHVPDPGAFLRAARLVLRRSGTLWLATPNIHAAAHSRFGRAWKHLDPPRHLVIFTSAALEVQLHAAGFGEVQARRSASGTIDTYKHSWRIGQGSRPLADIPIPPRVAMEGQLVGLRSLLGRARAEELVRIARPA